MIVLGLLVLLAVAAIAVIAIARGGDPVSFKLGSLTFNTDGAGMFLAGAGTLLVAVVGFWLLRKGMHRSRQRRQEMKELRDRAARNEEAARRARTTAEPTGTSAEPTGSTADSGTTTGNHVDESSRPGADDHFDSTPRER